MLFEDEINEAVRKLEQFGNAPVGNDLNRLISIVSSEVNKVVNERRDNDNNSEQSNNNDSELSEDEQREA